MYENFRATFSRTCANSELATAAAAAAAAATAIDGRSVVGGRASSARGVDGDELGEAEEEEGRATQSVERASERASERDSSQLVSGNSGREASGGGGGDGAKAVVGTLRIYL